ncbi:MAG: ribonuclease III [Thermodesulfobacteriota bacterium]
MEFSELQRKLSYDFSDESLLAEACRHSSYVNEHPESGVNSNERLEFLGDAVLNLVVSHLLMMHHTHVPEGDLSRMRATLVNEIQLSEIARNLDLGRYLRMGKGEILSGGREKQSILANALEAVIAAVYLDGGFQAAFEFVQKRFSTLVSSFPSTASAFDYKSKLQELVQVGRHAVPTYEVIEESGPDHDKTFTVRIQVRGIEAKGIGKSKKTAEQDAARNALERLERA